jgi:hypothetical protein
MNGTGFPINEALKFCPSAQRWHLSTSSAWGGTQPHIVEIRLIVLQSPEVSLYEAIATSASQSAQVAPTPSDGSRKGTAVAKKDDCTGFPSAQSVHLFPTFVALGTSSAVTPIAEKLRKMTDQRMKRHPRGGADLSFILKRILVICRKQGLLGDFSASSNMDQFIRPFMFLLHSSHASLLSAVPLHTSLLSACMRQIEIQQRLACLVTKRANRCPHNCWGRNPGSQKSK